MPNLKKAELLRGRVYVDGPVPHTTHGGPCADLMCLLGVYKWQTPGVSGLAHPTMRLDSLNEPQPDAVLMIEPRYGGQARISGDDVLTGAPELVAEVAYTRNCYDLDEKLEVYREFGVREYLVWRTVDQEFDWFTLRSGDFVTLEPLGGVYRSEVFPGLWIDADNLMQDRLGSAHRVLADGIASPPHAAFIERLGARRMGDER